MKTWPVPGDQLVKRRDGCPLSLSRRFLFRSVLLTKRLKQAIKNLSSATSSITMQEAWKLVKSRWKTITAHVRYETPYSAGRTYSVIWSF